MCKVLGCVCSHLARRNGRGLEEVFGEWAALPIAVRPAPHRYLVLRAAERRLGLLLPPGTQLRILRWLPLSMVGCSNGTLIAIKH